MSKEPIKVVLIGDSNSPGRWWWPPIKVERKTDLIALTAFIISLLTAFWQLSAYVNGPKIRCINPQQIMMFAADRGTNRYVHVNVDLTYINLGAKGYSDVVIKEWVTFSIEGQWYELDWKKFVHTYRDTNNSEILRSYEKDDASPFAVDGGDVVAHETSFQPLLSKRPFGDRRANYLEYSNFIAAVDKLDSITFIVSYETVDGRIAAEPCTVTLDPETKMELRKRSWSAPSCYPSDAIYGASHSKWF
jgi:hypothetical protein